MSFATAAALIPTAVALISLRDDVPSTRRCTFVVPWLGLAALFLISVDASSTSSNGLAHFADIPRYAFNFLGAGIARFATDLAPWLALGGLFVGAWAYADVRARRECLPWSGLCVFAIGASVLVAVGRTAAFGATHAFVTRYVSFSSMFWLGSTGLVGVRFADRGERVAMSCIVFVAVLAFANAIHIVRKARSVGMHAAEIAASIRGSYPTSITRFPAKSTPTSRTSHVRGFARCTNSALRRSSATAGLPR